MAFLTPPKEPLNGLSVGRAVNVDTVAVADRPVRIGVSERGVPDPFVRVEGRARSDVLGHDLAEGRAGTIRNDPRAYAAIPLNRCEHHRLGLRVPPLRGPSE